MMRRLVKVGIVILGLTVLGGAPVFAGAAPPIVAIDSATPAKKMKVKAPNLHVGETIVFKDKYPGNVTVQIGVWEADQYAYHIKNYPWTEYVLMINGRVVITNDDGTQNEFRAGDTFVIPKGFSNCSPGGSTGYSLSWLRQSTAFPCRAMVVATSGL